MNNQASKMLNSYTIADLGIALVLLIVLTLLSANIYVIYLASHSNDLACRDALNAAFKAFSAGKNMEGIMQAAQESLTTCSHGNFFIGHPQFTKFRYEKLPRAGSLVIETSIIARPPAPWLLADKEIIHDGKLTITKTYVLRMRNSQSDPSN